MAESNDHIKFLIPVLISGRSVEKFLQRRQSVRPYKKTLLSLAEAGQSSHCLQEMSELHGWYATHSTGDVNDLSLRKYPCNSEESRLLNTDTRDIRKLFQKVTLNQFCASDVVLFKER